MSRLLRACALALVLCAACDAGSPRTGSPGLEPPRGTDDAGAPLPTTEPGGETGGGGTGATGPDAAGMTGSGGGSGGAGGFSGFAGTGASAGSAADPGTSDAGMAPDAGMKFSELHEAELLKDCQETVQCRLQRDEQLEPDPFNACLEDSAAFLDADESRQAAFLANVERCRAFVVCDYYDCAISGP